MIWSAVIDKDDGHLVSAEELYGARLFTPKFVKEPKGGLKLEFEDGTDNSSK